MDWWLKCTHVRNICDKSNSSETGPFLKTIETRATQVVHLLSIDCFLVNSFIDCVLSLTCTLNVICVSLKISNVSTNNSPIASETNVLIITMLTIKAEFLCGAWWLWHRSIQLVSLFLCHLTNLFKRGMSGHGVLLDTAVT